MQFAPISKVTNRVEPGEARLSDTNTAYVARLQPEAKRNKKSEQLDTPIDRGAFVSLDKMLGPVDVVRRAPPSMLVSIWGESRARIFSTMRDPYSPEFRTRLEQACTPLQALIERDPNLAIFQVLREEGNTRLKYGIRHAMHTAVIGLLIANRLKWSASASNTVVKCALTMDLSMLELLGVLAASTVEPNAVQRRAIITHPVRSREMLESAGISDALWLRAVEQHHEQPDGRGYPSGRSDVSEIASLVRCADLYATKLSERQGWDPMPADRVMRMIYKSDPSNPFVTALVKEFGIYPPGSLIALESGEAGLVIRRGKTLTTPIVAVMTNQYRRLLPHPKRRDTALPGFGVTGLISASDLPLTIKPRTLSAILSV